MTANTTILDPKYRDELLILMHDKGTSRAAHFLDVCRQTLERAALGATVQRCTATAIMLKLKERSTQQQGKTS